jgi:hypothetical protein
MSNIRSVATLLSIVASVLGGCDGNSQPFEEAVEVRNLELVSLEVIAPANSQEQIFLNINQSLQFGVQGRKSNGESLMLSATGRQWAVSDVSVASVDGNGLLSAHANGITGVSVRIGDLVSPVFELTVSDATLSDIESISGPTMVERCIPQDYIAIGRYSDDTVRNLNSVAWTVSDSTNAPVTTDANAKATLTGLNPGALQLIASQGSLELPKSIEVLDTLSTLDILPSPAGVDVGSTQAFTATGTYNDEPTTGTNTTAGTRRILITQSVDWQITSGSGNATVINSGTDRGVVSGVASGTATLSASCGDLTDVQTVVVISKNSSDSTQLSFNTIDNPLRLLRSNTAGFRLRVSTGSTFSEGDEVTDDVVWLLNHESSTTPAINLATSGPDVGLIRPLAFGESTITATVGDTSIILTVAVVNS